MGSLTRPSYIAIARIVRTQGNKGEVLAELYTDFPTRFDGLEEVWLEFENDRRVRKTLERSWPHKGRRVLKFSGIDSISSAEELAGAWVVVPVDQAVALPEGVYFDHDLIGCLVSDLHGRVLGTVKEIRHTAGNSLLVVDASGGEFLVPAVGEICKRVSIKEKEIAIDVPEGLMDLNK